MTDIMEDRPEFTSVDGRRFHLIKVIKPKSLLVWENLSDMGNTNVYNGSVLDVMEVDMENLKAIGAWEDLTVEVRELVEHRIKVERHEIAQNMERARACRKSKYNNIPKELVCIQCGKKQVVSPYIIVAKVDKIIKGGRITNIPEYIAQWKCTKCNPTQRGKKASPEFANLPKTMKCKCGKVVSTNPYQLKVKAGKMGVTIHKLIEDFVCQSCCPSKRGRKVKSN